MDVSSRNDVVDAFMETLVDPRLPFRVSRNDPPSEDAQKAVARQMHAVVLLYNYYHRKQNANEDFLDFISFCKLAVSLRPPMVTFMKMTKESEPMELNDAEGQLSVTEKAIKDACDIAVVLDASKDVPTTEGYPISKVAVLLIDSAKENCLLQFGGITEGVWSLIEKELTDSYIVAEEKVGNKGTRKSNEASMDGIKFLKHACDAVKDITGIDSSDIKVLKTHVAYSLSKEKSATQFYMMHCPESFSVYKSVPIKFVVESLQGPLAEETSLDWRTTTVVEYHHMLPYVGFISSWLSGKDLCPLSIDGKNAQSIINDYEKLTESRVRAVPVPKYNGDLDHWSDSKKKVDASKTIPEENNKDSQKKRKLSSDSKVEGFANICRITKKDGIVTNKIKKTHGVQHSTKGDAIETGKAIDVEDSNIKKGRNICSDTSDTQGDECLKNSISDSPLWLQKANKSDFTKMSTEREHLTKKLNSEVRSNHQRKNISSPQHDIVGLETGNNFKVEMPRLLSSSDTQRRDEKVADGSGAFNQSGIPGIDKSVVRVEASSKCDTEHEVMASEDLQNALALLYRKRQELNSQICTMEDSHALYEDYIERIRDGGDLGLARQCIKAILSGDDPLLLKNENQIQDNVRVEKHTELSNIYLPGKSSFQDLEYICLKNNWRLPRYTVEPSEGKFLSSVVVEGKGLKFFSKGGLECHPSDARESAAAHMIAEISTKAKRMC